MQDHIFISRIGCFVRLRSSSIVLIFASFGTSGPAFEVAKPVFVFVRARREGRDEDVARVTMIYRNVVNPMNIIWMASQKNF